MNGGFVVFGGLRLKPSIGKPHVSLLCTSTLLISYFVLLRLMLQNNVFKLKEGENHDF